MAVLKQRTPEELRNPELNYFIAFDIDLTENNVKKIEEALNSKRKTFARVVTPVTTRLIELKDDIDQIMLQDATFGVDATGAQGYVPKSGGRKAEVERAKKFYLKRAIEMAETICKSGYIEDVKIEEIAKRFFVTPQEVEAGIAGLLAQGVELKKVVGAKREVAFSNYKKIDSYLRTLGKRDIYDFSELPENSDIKVLFAKQEELYSLYSKKANDAKAKAAMDLSGIGKVIFKSPAAKKEYDVYLRTKSKVWDSLSTLSDSGIKIINEKFFTGCLDSLRADAGLSVADAEKEIYAYMSFFKLTRETTDKVQIAVCPYPDCGKSYVVVKGIKVCPNCGKTLEIRCWNCGEVMLYTGQNQGCSKCGITKESQTKFDTAQKAFQAVLKNASCSDVDLANALNQMENVYPNYDKMPSSFVAKTIADAKAQIEKKKKEKEALNAIYEKYVKEINSLIAKKCFCKAESVLKQLKNEDATYNVKEIENKISTAIKSAQQYVDIAKKHLQSNNEFGAIDSCGKALAICSDHSAAIQILKNYPPKAPTNLVVRVIRNTVKLDWATEGDQTAITYSVIRKVGSVPANDEDGEILDKDLTINFFEDSEIVSATPYYYAVFAERGGIRSAIMKSTTPAVLFRDITNLHQEKISDAIKATWAVPDNVKGVEIVRKSGAIPPANINDGEKIVADGLNGFTDKKATEDKYSYLIVCKYNYQGKDCYSTGIKASYSKFKMPVELTQAKVEPAGAITDFNFSCEIPKNGSVKLYVSPKKLDFAFGEADEKANFAKKCRELREIDATIIAENKFYFSAPEKSILWLYPVVANDQLYVVCKPLFINTISGIESVNVVNKNGNIVIEGVVDSSVRNIIAVISEKDFEEDIDADAEKRVCSYDTFVKEKGFYMGLKPGMYYITLFAEFNEGGKKSYSRATRLPEVVDNREKEIVVYAMSYTSSVTSAYNVKITFKANRELELPKVDIVRGYPKPLNKSSGVVVATIPGGQMKKKLFKNGYYYSVNVKVDRADSQKDKIVLFFNSEANNNVKLKEVLEI